MPTIPLTAEQEAEAQHFYELIENAFLDEARQVARLLASKQDGQLLGQTEFQLRDALHRLGAKALETALNERKKGGIRSRA